MHSAEKDIAQLYEKIYGTAPLEVNPLPLSGSERRYFRLLGEQGSVIGAWNPDAGENFVFMRMSQAFSDSGVNVPQVIGSNTDARVYLLDDLGDETLLSHLEKNRKGDVVSEASLGLYRQSLDQLVTMQVKGFAALQKDHPGIFLSPFDRTAMLWDLNYFKYCFLKPAGARFNEALLEKDFQSLISFLEDADAEYFMHRDFQARNIMVHEGRAFIIDFQGGRKGPLQYDVASLLWQAKADLSAEVRSMLLDHYLSQLQKATGIDPQKFLRHYPGFILLRVLQTLGAYGFRGYFERKKHFLDSIPFALKNAQSLLAQTDIPPLPEIAQALESIQASRQDQDLKVKPPEELTVRICSFSYRYPMPEDQSGNGGGFVFDCRAITNPGRLPEYEYLTGLDEPVIQFLREQTAFPGFMKEVTSLVEASVNKYLERGFTHLTVNFGCTGGQHRSVAGAEQLAAFLRKQYPVHVELIHFNRHNWKLRDGGKA